MTKTGQTRDVYQQVAERLAGAERVCALTGAGISRESGVPTFREADGLWNRFRPEELANVDAFLSNPDRVWEWYSWRRKLIGNVRPNPGHSALAELERLLPHFALVTQNVDNLHRQAGTRDVIELHGNILRNKCQKCGIVFEPGTPEAEMDFEPGTLPVCTCGKEGLLRPDVVWFGEMLPERALARAWDEAQSCDVFLSVGTSAVVFPAAGLPYQAKSAGAVLVEINPNRTELTPVADHVISEPSGEALPEVIDRLRALKTTT
ncbi:MAG: NAD-dependent protein deacylase [Calditrichaeota bacterium]|nr:NAD-dependent protein deacylase [Calditrichota bacterium]